MVNADAYGTMTEAKAINELEDRPVYVFSYLREPIAVFNEDKNSKNPPIVLHHSGGNHWDAIVTFKDVAVYARSAVSNYSACDKVF